MKGHSVKHSSSGNREEVILWTSDGWESFDEEAWAPGQVTPYLPGPNVES